MVMKEPNTGSAFPVAGCWQGGEEKPEGEGVAEEGAEEGEGGGDGCLQNPPCPAAGAAGTSPRVV